MTHVVLLFPDDGAATLRAVLTQTNTGGIVSNPMEDMLLVCSTEADAIYIRCGLDLRWVTQKALLVRAEDQQQVAGWLLLQGMASRCDWAALEHFEFWNAAAMDRTIEVFSDVVGREPYSLPLNLWPTVFRPNLSAPHAAIPSSPAP